MQWINILVVDQDEKEVESCSFFIFRLLFHLFHSPSPLCTADLCRICHDVKPR